MKKNRKITRCLILAVLCALSLCACASGDYGVGTGEQKPIQVESTSEPFLTKEERTEQVCRELIREMSLEEKVGQLFFVRCDKETAEEDVAEYHVGGLILFAADTEDETPVSLGQKIDAYQANAKVGLLIGVDEEGGTVNRVSRFSQYRAEPFASPQQLYEQGGMEQIAADTEEKAALLSSLGINVNLAPVCDVSTDADDFIYARAFGKPAEETAEYVRTVVSTMRANNMGSTMKHFPGYGDNEDTHTGIAIDERPYRHFEESDFLPFRAGAKAGADSVLVSHNIVTCMDEKMPASLSPEVHRVLREEIGFDGVVMTDDLAMAAIRDYVGNETSAVLAVLAGNDMVLASDYKEQIPSVLHAVEEGRISEKRIEESLMRILKWKDRLGLLPY